MTTTVPLIGQARCSYRECRRYLPANSGSGPRAAFCDPLCRRRERYEREKDAGLHQRRGHREIRPERREHRVGAVFGDLTLIEYLPPAKGGVQALFHCSCGQVKPLRVGNVASGATTTCGSRSHRLTVPTPVYSTAHTRKAAVDGPAKARDCAMCGNPASHWSYDHADADERRDTTGKDTGRPFSVRTSHYKALCRSCHVRFDRASRAHTSGGLPSGVHVALHMLFCTDQDCPCAFELPADALEAPGVRVA